MARRIALVVAGAAAALLLVAGALGAVVLTTQPGHGALRRWAAAALGRAVDGTVRIGSVGGPLWRALDVSDVSLATSDGRPVIRVERVRISFALTDLLRRRFRLSHVQVIRPTVVLEQDTAGRWNIERLFRMGGPPVPERGPRPLVELRGVHLTDGTVIVRPRIGPRRTQETYTALGVNLDLRQLRASHPDSSGIAASLAHLEARLVDPALAVRDAAGDVALAGDSVRFSLTRLTLPGTRAAARGRIAWGGGRTTFDVSLSAASLAFSDVRALVPRLPSQGGGRLALTARRTTGGATEIGIEGARISSGRSTLSGGMRATLSPRGGLSLRGLDVALAPLDLALLRAYVDTLPVRGLVRGRLAADGALGSLSVRANLAFTDEGVPGFPSNLIVARGRLALGGRDGLAFRGLALSPAELAFATLRHFVPAAELEGRLRAEGDLEGPWRAARFRGRLTHLGRDSLASTLRGDVALALGEPVRLDLDAVVDSLSFDLLRRTWPSIPLAGSASGRMALHGPTTALAVEVALTGAGGALGARGVIGLGTASATVALSGRFDSLDLRRHQAGLPASRLAGSWAADLLVPSDTAALSTGNLRLLLGRGSIGGLDVASGAAAVGLTAGALVVDSAVLATGAGSITAAGTVGRRAGAAGQLGFALRFDTLAYLEPLLRRVLADRGDTTPVKLSGAGTLRGRLAGDSENWTLDGSVQVESADYGDVVARALRAHGTLSRRAGRLFLDLTAALDSAGVGGLGYAPAGFSLSGRPDSLLAGVSAGFGPSSALHARLAVWGDSAVRWVRLDSLRFELPARSLSLVRPARLRITSQMIEVDTLELRPTVGGGRLFAEGWLPRSGVGDFWLIADSVPMVDLVTLAERDTTGVGGSLDLAVRILGPAAEPTMEARVAVTDARYADYRFPLVQVLGRYQDRQLTLKGGLWRGDVRAVSLSGSLPVDLSLRGVQRRRLPGPLELVAHADSVDLAALGPLTDVATGLAGILRLDARVRGSWDDYTVAGYADLADGALTIPALGVRYNDVNLRLDLENDVVRVSRGRVGSGGTLEISGRAELGHGQPVLDLALTARRFAAFDIRSFGALVGSGELTLRGPLLGATLTGRLDVDAGYLKFADLVEKRVVNLDDPEFRAIVDSNLARAARLEPGAETVFLDSLRVSGLRVVMGPDVWLRSNEANIQLAGEFVVDKWVESRLQRYRLDGTLRAVRGTYRLVLGPVTKDFRVSRGTVRFYGTPDFNPDLDIVAEHELRTVQGSQMTVRALIQGTLLYPRLSLESDYRPPLSETEIVGYLLFGAPPSSEAGAMGSREAQALIQSGLAGVAGGLGQGLISTLGLPLDYLTILPGAANPRGGLGLNTARIGAGAQIGSRTFLTLTAGLCEVLTSQLVGAGVEYRLSRSWSAAASFEPIIHECGTAASLTGVSSRYQLSFDLFWQQGIR